LHSHNESLELTAEHALGKQHFRGNTKVMLWISTARQLNSLLWLLSFIIGKVVYNGEKQTDEPKGGAG
jgi:hypothetical protein